MCVAFLWWDMLYGGLGMAPSDCEWNSGSTYDMVMVICESKKDLALKTRRIDVVVVFWGGQ